jgi:hypothetical protein
MGYQASCPLTPTLVCFKGPTNMKKYKHYIFSFYCILIFANLEKAKIKWNKKIWIFFNFNFWGISSVAFKAKQLGAGT